MKHLVSFEALQSAEALTALGAAVGPHPRVLPLVSLQVSRLSEVLPAVCAQVRLLSSVSPEVHVELPGVGEALAAVWAAVRLLTCVDALMLLEPVMVREAFSAVSAQVKHLHLLEARVSFQSFPAWKALPTVRTFTLLLLFIFVFLWLFHVAVWVLERQILSRVVPFDVFDEVTFHSEGELAERAREELRRAVVLLTCVVLLMLLQVSRCSEDFTAALTIVGMSCLFVSLQEAGLVKRRPTLATLVLPQSTNVCFQILLVSVRSFAAIAAEPFVFG